MTPTRRILTLCLASSLAMTLGCPGPEPEPSSPVRAFIEDTSPADLAEDPASFALHPLDYLGASATLPFVAMILLAFEPDLTCPTVEDNSTETHSDLVIRGGCTFDAGTPEDTADDWTWTGVAYVEGDESGLTIRSEDFGLTSESPDCPGIEQTLISDGVFAQQQDEHGSVTVTETGLLHVDGPFEGCVIRVDTFAVDGGGEILGGGDETTDEVVYNLTFDVAIGSVGRWSTRAVDLLHSRSDQTSEGEVCPEPISGSIVSESGGDEVAVLPDGGSQCNIEACAPYTLNGEPQGEVCGILGL